MLILNKSSQNFCIQDMSQFFFYYLHGYTCNCNKYARTKFENNIQVIVHNIIIT